MGTWGHFIVYFHNFVIIFLFWFSNYLHKAKTNIFIKLEQTNLISTIYIFELKQIIKKCQKCLPFYLFTFICFREILVWRVSSVISLTSHTCVQLGLFKTLKYRRSLLVLIVLLSGNSPVSEISGLVTSVVTKTNL